MSETKKETPKRKFHIYEGKRRQVLCGCTNNATIRLVCSEPELDEKEDWGWFMDGSEYDTKQCPVCKYHYCFIKTEKSKKFLRCKSEV